MEKTIRERNKVFDKHYRDNYKELVVKLYRYAGSKHNAEDVIQTAYMKGLQYYKPEVINDFDSWFNQIIKHCLNDYRNKERAVV